MNIFQKYIKFSILSVILVFSNLVASPIEVSIPTQQGYIGDTLLIPIEIDSITASDSISSYNFRLAYDQSILEIMEIEDQATLSENTFLTANITPDEIILAMASTTFLSGQDPLIYIKARCKGDGSTALEWNSFLFNHGDPAALTNDSRFDVVTSDVENYQNQNVANYVLENSYPNPFNSSTTINYQIKKPGFINISIYDLNGKKVVTLKNNFVSSGYHQLKWNAFDSHNSPVSSGVYFVNMNINNYQETKKVLYAK